jgi:hypothetical protein
MRNFVEALVPGAYGCDWRLTESLLQLLAAGVNIPDAALADSV